MSDHERGAYTPPTSDAPLAFDARQPVRGARPIPFTLILSVLVLAAIVAAIFVFYRSGVREAGQAPPIVGAPAETMRSAAPPEAQPVDPAAGLQVYKSEAHPMDAEPPQFTEPPEEPQARPTTSVVVSPPAAPPPQAQPTIRPALPAAPPVQQAPPEPAPAPVAKAAPAPPPKASEPKIVAKAEPPAPKPAPAAAGSAKVQVGAVSSTALADRAWSEAVAAAPGLAAGKGKSVEKIEGGSLYRTFVTGFASKADAQAFCARLQAAGKSCFVR